MELSLPSLVSMAGYDKLAVPNQTPSFKRTDIGPRDSVPLVMADLSAGDGAGFNVLSQPCYRRAVTGGAPNATISRRSSPIVTGVIFGGAFVAGLAVLLSLLLPFYLKRRGRNLQSTHTDDLENGASGQASNVSSGDSPLPVSHSNDWPQRNSRPAPSVSQVSSKPALVRLPPPPPYQMIDEGNGNARLPVPACPPPVLLWPERAYRSARQGDSFTTAGPRTIRPREVLIRDGSNSWDRNAIPPSSASRRVTFQLPSSTSPLRRTKAFKAGLPQNPRETRTFL